MKVRLRIDGCSWIEVAEKKIFTLYHVSDGIVGQERFIKIEVTFVYVSDA